MNVPIWLLLIAPPVIGALGFFIGVRFMAKKVADAQDNADLWERSEQACSKHFEEVSAAHNRATDALNATRARIDRALEQVTPGANATVQRIARILRGEA